MLRVLGIEPASVPLLAGPSLKTSRTERIPPTVRATLLLPGRGRPLIPLPPLARALSLGPTQASASCTGVCRELRLEKGLRGLEEFEKHLVFGRNVSEPRVDVCHSIEHWGPSRAGRGPVQGPGGCVVVC